MLDDNEERSKATKRTADDEQDSADERVAESAHQRQRVATEEPKTAAELQLEFVKAQQAELQRKNDVLQMEASDLMLSIELDMVAPSLSD